MELPVLQSQPPAATGGCSASSCGTTDEQANQLPDSIREKIQNHPCYSEDAHHYFARMHVAVAPACNIQCHYCNRKYDCSNESRPGVVSELLTPDQAVKKTMAVAANIPQMTVLGIAGPGDPLANPERTFETFRQLSKDAPDIKLCVSTNGLALPESVEELAKHNIDHVPSPSTPWTRRLARRFTRGFSGKTAASRAKKVRKSSSTSNRKAWRC